MAAEAVGKEADLRRHYGGNPSLTPGRRKRAWDKSARRPWREESRTREEQRRCERRRFDRRAGGAKDGQGTETEAWYYLAIRAGPARDHRNRRPSSPIAAVLPAFSRFIL